MDEGEKFKVANRLKAQDPLCWTAVDRQPVCINETVDMVLLLIFIHAATMRYEQNLFY